MNGTKQLFTRLLQAWKTASPAGRLLVGASVLVTFVAMIGVSVWSSVPDYKLLREGISPVTTADIVSKLDAKGIPNKMNYSGTGVLVPAGRWNEANISISSLDAGPAPEREGNKGSFLQPRPGHDSATRNRELALEGSLESLQAIKSADVHLAIPKPSPFRSKRQPPSASVIVEAAPNRVISNEIAHSIVHTVAAAVEGLTPQNVTLSDSNGQMIGGGKTDPASARREYIAELESSLALKAQDILSAVLGPNRSVVRVTAEVDDFLDKLTTKQQIVATDKVRLTEKITSSDQTGMASTSFGTAGTASNNGAGLSPISGADQPVSGKFETNETTYDYPRTTEEVREIGGQVKRLSISATVDVSQPNAPSQPADPSKQLLTQEQVEGIIKTAVGFDATRGDQIEVLMSEFTAMPIAALDLEIPHSEKWNFVSQLARNSSLGLAAIAALLLTMMILKKVKPIEIKASSNGRQAAILSTLSSRFEENPDALSKLLAAWIDSENNGEKKRAA